MAIPTMKQRRKIAEKLGLNPDVLSDIKNRGHESRLKNLAAKRRDVIAAMKKGGLIA